MPSDTDLEVWECLECGFENGYDPFGFAWPCHRCGDNGGRGI